MMLLEVAVAAPLDHTLTYGLPPALCGAGNQLHSQDYAGRRVLVPLGRRRLTGYVLGPAVSSQVDFTIREIVDFLDGYAIFPKNLIPFYRWIANYYHYPIGEVIRTALPPGLSPQSVRLLRMTEDDPYRFAQSFTGKVPVWAEQLMHSRALSASVTKEVLRQSKERKIVDSLVSNGLLEITESLTGDTSREKHEVCYSLCKRLPAPEESATKNTTFFKGYTELLTNETGQSLKLSEAKTLYYLAEYATASGRSTVPVKELRGRYSGASRALPSLMEKQLIEKKTRRVFRSPLGEQLAYYPPPTELTGAQKKVLDQLKPAIKKGSYQPFLLHGVTSSGKTEVYLRACEETLKIGRDVLVIVPEIALASQLEAHFVSRFGNGVVLLHSGLSSAEKFDQWCLALNNKATIVIGARSAVFAPLNQPGLIIVDEEHDSGLKQDDSLRYSGRDLAVVRAKMQNAVVLLGSATPSVSSYYNCLSGKYRLLSMKQRVGERALPKVTIIDLRQKAQSKKNAVFRPPLLQALESNLAAGNQSVILLNRRGFSTTVLCRECGAPVHCKDCNVALTMHLRKQQLLCHYCGYSVHSQTICSICGSHSMVPVGFGTERVEEELLSHFPEARVARLDADTSGDRNTFLTTLKNMRDGAIDILVGTQMVAKGHHFPGVTLVGVVWADGGLSIPDYRAAEKTFQLITQVTGRAGRGEVPGEVYIQTMRPDHYALELARRHEYRELVEKELELRKNPLFPPFVRLTAVHIQGEKEAEVSKSAKRIASACRALPEFPGGIVEVLGPAPAPIDKIKKNFRWQVLLKAVSSEALQAVCRYIRTNSGELTSGKCRVMLDVDPDNMM